MAEGQQSRREELGLLETAAVDVRWDSAKRCVWEVLEGAMKW